jgi:hypothetical protein
VIRVSCVAMACALALTSWCEAAAQTRVKRAEIVDHAGFERPLVASTILIPVDWQAEGGVVWNTQGNACGSGYNFDWRASSPDGLSGVHIFPTERWQWNSWGMPDPAGCPTAQITSVRQYIEDLVGRGRPGARILDFRRRADIEQELSQLNQTTPMPMGEMQSWVEAGEALLAYGQNGVEVRETVALAVLFTVMRTEATMGMPGSESWTGATFPGYAVRAPVGSLDFRMTEMMRKSIQPQPEWSARIAEHEARIAGIQIQGARERSRIISQTGEEIRQTQADSWRRHNASSDRLARESSEAIRGVETYDDPYRGGTVELDNAYEHAWQLLDGTYVLTDDPSFEPYRDLGIEGRRLEVTR